MKMNYLPNRQRAALIFAIPLLAAVLFFGLWSVLGKTAVFAAHDDPQPNDPSADMCFVEVTGDTITDYSSADASAVQTAVDAVSDKTFLKIAGTCDGVQERNGITQTVYISKSISMQGGYTSTNWLADPDQETFPTILDAAGDGRVIVIKGSLDTEISLENLVLTEGYAEFGDGGGLNNSGANVTISNTIISESLSDAGGGGLVNDDQGVITLINSQIIINEAEYGGGVANENATMTISNTIISENLAEISGGGLQIGYPNNSTVTLHNSQIFDNEAGNGGGIYISSNGVVLTMTESAVYNNTAVLDNGGGLAAYTLALLMIENSQFYGNSAINNGGGLYLFNGIQLRLSQSTIMSNTAKTERGGGIYIRQNADVEIENSTISGNNAAGEDGTTNDNGNGGGLYIGALEVPSIVTVTHSTITDNYAAGEGGGLDFNRFAPGDVLTFRGTILAGNSAGGTHQDCYDYDTNNYTFNTDAYNLFNGSVDDDCPVVGSDLSLADLGVTIADVIAPNLADNGGDTVTHALVAGSSAINIIPENDCFAALDQRGVSRPQFQFCDIGSVEYKKRYVYLPIILK